MADETLLALVVDIVSAQVSHNSVSANDLPALIQSVYGSLVKLGEAQAPVEEKREPAASIRTSVKPDAITCLECGAKFKMLKRHLATDHSLTPETYRTRWNLPASYPLVAPDYAAKRKELAVRIGLGRKPVAAPASVPEPVKAKAPRRKKLAPAFEEVTPPVEG
ncbi:MucR family transcriptional regulator [Novosphingobium sp. Fuku2-ISO-50]|uniref:MucR family transcriptional regulator n=1 Tax=Novosphingobium sp. Fuku2-ISO-50 TaxID=1739114 RepID=UPI00076D97DD|nr:MucR family transcriptional regulator [Novosphingobium sp. Fuku2-ISO-50]KUR75286.1 MucR family transcriptional regulator [Novosphingobium sp. Fuku2-ISO-50]